MKVFFHFAFSGFANTYLVGPNEGGKALLIDPGIMDITLLNLIEKNNYYIDTILVTNAHEAHMFGIKTLRKIYNAQIYCGVEKLYDFGCVFIRDGQTIDFHDTKIKIYQVMGHTKESMVFRIDTMLFTGDALGAGKVGDSPNPYARRVLMKMIDDKLLPLEEDLFIFPGHGPPSTLKLEKLYNPMISELIAFRRESESSS